MPWDGGGGEAELGGQELGTRGSWGLPFISAQPSPLEVKGARGGCPAEASLKCRWNRKRRVEGQAWAAGQRP